MEEDTRLIVMTEIREMVMDAVPNAKLKKDGTVKEVLASNPAHVYHLNQITHILLQLEQFISSEESFKVLDLAIFHLNSLKTNVLFARNSYGLELLTQESFLE